MRRLVLLVAVAACAAEPEMPPKTGEVAQEAGVCADGTTVYGIDVSRFQGTIDWAKVANSGVKFAFIQISRSLTDIDAKFEFNWAGAKQNGILRGAYQRFHPGQDVIGQANIFLDKLGPFQDGDLPPVLDVEDADGLPAATIAARVKQWVDKVEPVVGVKPIIYTGFFFWRDMVGGADMSAYPLWVPNYSATCPLVPPAWTDWTIHQYSSTAMVPGITENTTDVNKFNGTIEQLEALGKPLRPCQVIEPAGGVVDDSSSCFVAGGDPQFIRHEAAGYDSSLQWTHTTDLAAPSNFGKWNLDFAEAGTYRVEVFTPAPFNRSKQAVYKVAHAGATDDFPVDQSSADGWHVLGELAFDAGGGNQSVRVDDNTGEPNSTNTQLVFDAVRLTRIDGTGPMPDGGMNPDPHPQVGGCSAGGGAARWPILVLFLALRRRARR